MVSSAAVVLNLHWRKRPLDDYVRQKIVQAFSSWRFSAVYSQRRQDEGKKVRKGPKGLEDVRNSEQSSHRHVGCRVHVVLPIAH